MISEGLARLERSRREMTSWKQNKNFEDDTIKAYRVEIFSWSKNFAIS